MESWRQGRTQDDGLSSWSRHFVSASLTSLVLSIQLDIVSWDDNKLPEGPMPFRRQQLAFRHHEIHIMYEAFRKFLDRDPQVELETIDASLFDNTSWTALTSSKTSVIKHSEDIILTGHSFGGATAVSSSGYNNVWEHILTNFYSSLYLQPNPLTTTSVSQFPRLSFLTHGWNPSLRQVLHPTPLLITRRVKMSRLLRRLYRNHWMGLQLWTVMPVSRYQRNIQSYLLSTRRPLQSGRITSPDFKRLSILGNLRGTV